MRSEDLAARGRDWITQDELARLFPHGLPVMAVKLLFPEKSEPLNTAEVYAFLVALSSRALARLADAEAQVGALARAARPFAEVADLFDSEVEGAVASDTLSIWLNGDDEEPSWRVVDFKLGDFGALRAALAAAGGDA